MPEPIPPSQRIRWFAALALALAGVALLAVVFLTPHESRSPSPGVVRQVPIDPSLVQDVPGVGVSSKRRLVDHPEEKKLPPALGRTFYVSPDETNPSSDGSLDEPWSDLQQAFAELEPGDRLVILPGPYKGSFVVDAPARDGTAERPIEVWARVDARLRGDSEAPVLEVRRAHWRFVGVEIEPGSSARFAFATRGEGARHVTFDGGHLRDGSYNGILIGPGSAHVTIANTHIHVFGPIERGKTMRLEDQSTRPRSVAGILIAPGTSDIVITGNNIHNILGPPLLVLAPDQYALDGPRAGKALPPAARVAIDASNTLQENWSQGEAQ